ncbi:hypothetical protein V6N13_080634 [Hibiscus sabdariffa]
MFMNLVLKWKENGCGPLKFEEICSIGRLHYGMSFLGILIQALQTLVQRMNCDGSMPLMEVTQQKGSANWRPRQIQDQQRFGNSFGLVWHLLSLRDFCGRNDVIFNNTLYNDKKIYEAALLRLGCWCKCKWPDPMYSVKWM